jgi:hypothetical protein
MTLYDGELFGFRFQKEFKDDAEFEEWLYQKLKKYQFIPIILRVFDRLLNDTDTIKAVKAQPKEIVPK